jgi:hypothetical protein
MSYKTTEYFSLTKETIEREATAEEIKDIKQRQALNKALELAKQERAIQKAGLLERMGLTEDEAKLLLS